MTARLNDAEVRVELERIDPELVECFDATKIRYLPHSKRITVYRLLAESQQALREIANFNRYPCGAAFGGYLVETYKKWIDELKAIAKNARKEV